MTDLASFVERAQPLSFTYLRAHRTKGSEAVPCSRRLIRARVHLCVRLQLVADTGQLTRIGTAVLRDATGTKQLGRQALPLLAEWGFNVDATLATSPRGNGSLPTALELYDKGEIAVPLTEFRRLLNLLVECGHLRAVQSRMYFLHSDEP